MRSQRGKEAKTQPLEKKQGGRINRPPTARGRGNQWHDQGNRIGHRKHQPSAMMDTENGQVPV